MKSTKLLNVIVAVFTCLVAPFNTAAKEASHTIVASKAGIILDSDVWNGGGTDQTAKLQVLLDKAPKWGRLELILDGAALISKPLRLHSNTTISCPDLSCGLFLANGSNCSVITNANPDLETIKDSNITIDGGTYNNNSPGQVHDIQGASFFSSWVFAMEFYGVEHLTLKNLTIANQRTFALTMANWKFVNVENVHIDRRVRTDLENQDGLHFFGPGRFLNIKNVYGNSGDDFIAIAPDEVDHVSSISDVLIDGVFLDDADQGIRLLCCGKGRLERCVVRNVSGTYKSFGFIVNPWFEAIEGGGSYSGIVFDNINLKAMEPNYTYAEPFLFKLGGDIEDITIRNVNLDLSESEHHFAVLGGHYMRDSLSDPANPTNIGRLTIEGTNVKYPAESSPKWPLLDMRGAKVESLYQNGVNIQTLK